MEGVEAALALTGQRHSLTSALYQAQAVEIALRQHGPKSSLPASSTSFSLRAAQNDLSDKRPRVRRASGSNRLVQVRQILACAEAGRVGGWQKICVILEL